MKSEGKSDSIRGNPAALDIGRIYIRLENKVIQLFFTLTKNWSIQNRMEAFSQKSQHFLEEIKSLGFTRTMDELEKGKLSVFNQLNFFQFIQELLCP